MHTARKLEQKLIYALQDEVDSGFSLVIVQNQKAKRGSIIVQTTANEQHVNFEIMGEKNIAEKKILQRIKVRCYSEAKQVKIPIEEYYNIIEQINKGGGVKQQAQQPNNRFYDMDDQSMSERQSSSQSYVDPKRKRQISEYHDYSDMENDDAKKRGRGRPKGSRNKKNLMKEAGKDPLQDLKLALNCRMKRGKGRPKGSKNKPKDRVQSSNLAKNENPPVELPYGKRGKGRPKGSKNKIKLPQASIHGSESGVQKERKGRGRPKGAKNKPHSTISNDEEQQEKSQTVEKVEVQRIDPEQCKEIICCRRCQQTKLKRDVENDRIHLVDAYQNLTNICQDFGLQDKTNLVLGAIKNAQADYVKKLLTIVRKNEPSFKPPFDVQRMIEKNRYQVKTKKQFLTRNGKEGISALLHDCYKKKDVWWKQLSIDRIIEALPKQTYGKDILQALLEISPQLREQLYLHFPIILRNGNQFIAEIILKDMLMNQNYNLIAEMNNLQSTGLPNLNFSQEHLDLLVGNRDLLPQLQKNNLVKHNDGSHFCSPIHCAAISSNKDFLKELLTIFSDIINVQDSVQRKPIHYAAASVNSANLQALVNAGADLIQFDRKKITPLMIACMQGHPHNTYFILQKVRDPSYINTKSEEGYTALHYAILRNSQECLEILLQDPYVDLKAQTKDGEDVFHLVAGTGNLQIFERLIKKNIFPKGQDKFKRTPLPIAIRNHHTQMFYRLIQEGAKATRCDSSNNTLLHYAAAYGNPEIILFLKDKLEEPQVKNKRGFYPWEMAILKGHKDCAELLREDQQEQHFSFQFDHDPLFLMLTNIRGTSEYLDCVKYIFQNSKCDIKFQDKITCNGYLHLVCSYGEDQYQKIRKNQSNLSSEQIKQEFHFIQSKLIDFFLSVGLDGNQQNRKKQTPLKMCVENYNLIGVRKLLKRKINFDLQSSYGTTIMHCLSSLACMGLQQMDFVQKKLNDSDINQLKVNLKKIDQNGFDFILFFVKTFTETAKKVFTKIVKKKAKQGSQEPEKLAFEDFAKYQGKFLDLLKFLISMGCDINSQVVDKKTQLSENFKKWGIQHFLMSFPSLRIIKFIKNSKIRDLNAQNSKGRSPLHLFCINNCQGNLFQASIELHKDYKAQYILEYLLENGMNPSTQDSNRSLAILYAALNNQYSFISILRRHKSPINVCNNKNQVPLIQILKNSRHYQFDQIQNILKSGADPNFEDLDKRNALHHLVYYSNNFDTSPDVCKLLFDYGVKVNAVDKYKRSPIFYCFTKINPEDTLETQTNDKVEILQTLLNNKDINLNLQDAFQRTMVHYACEKNYFFSILYLLDKNINIQSIDHQKNTPLGVCLKHRNLDQAALIIKKGVKYGFVYQGNQKSSYFAYAMNNLSVGICFMLLDYGYPIQKALQEVDNEQAFKQILIQKYIK